MVLYVEVCHLFEICIQVEKDLIVYEVLKRLLVVVHNEHCVYESEVESLCSQILIDVRLVLASHTSHCSRRLCPHGSLILTFEELDLQILHICHVKIPKKLIVFESETQHVIDPVLDHILLICEVE